MTKGTFRGRCVHIRGLSAKTIWNEIVCCGNMSALKMTHRVKTMRLL